MSPRPHTVLALGRHRHAPPIDDARDEAIDIPDGETRYELLLNEESVELLSRGICSEAVSQRCFKLLEWKREAVRALSHELAPPAPARAQRKARR